MKKRFPFWIFGLLGILLIIVFALVLFLPKSGAAAADNPQAGLPEHPVHVDHKDIVQGPFTTGQEVTQACLKCHPEAAKDIMATTHWTWESKQFNVPWRDVPVTIGLTGDTQSEVLSGLQEGDLVLTSQTTTTSRAPRSRAARTASLCTRSRIRSFNAGNERG